MPLSIEETPRDLDPNPKFRYQASVLGFRECRTVGYAPRVPSAKSGLPFWRQKVTPTVGDKDEEDHEMPNFPHSSAIFRKLDDAGA